MVPLESEVFLTGKWKDYEELENSLSMPELTAILIAIREGQHQERKFFAAIQGVDIEAGDSKNSSNAWEDLKSRVFSGGQANDSNDIISLQGINAQQAGFGIGAGLEYDNFKDSEPSSPFD